MTTKLPQSYEGAIVRLAHGFEKYETEFPLVGEYMPARIVQYLRTGGVSDASRMRIEHELREMELLIARGVEEGITRRQMQQYLYAKGDKEVMEEKRRRSAARASVMKPGLDARASNKVGTVGYASRVLLEKGVTETELLSAMDYGSDFRQVLFSVAEELPAEQLRPLLERVASIHEAGERFAKLFDGFDDTISQSVNRAIGERTAEALCVVEALTKSGESGVSARVLGNRITIDSIDEVTDALALIEKAFQRIIEGYGSGRVTPSYDENGRSAWHLGAEGDVLLQIKEIGSERGAHRKGVEHSEEAQINFSTDVTSNNGEYVPLDIANYRRRNALSIRIDLEGILRDANGGRVGFDATQDVLRAALDMGSLRGSRTNPNVQVGRVTALGNKLRKRKLHQGRSLGYHTPLSEEYGKKETFRSLAGFMAEKMRRRAGQRQVGAFALGHAAHPRNASPEKTVAA